MIDHIHFVSDYLSKGTYEVFSDYKKKSSGRVMYVLVSLQCLQSCLIIQVLSCDVITLSTTSRSKYSSDTCDSIDNFCSIGHVS
jgi:hypothetical protein